VLASNFFGVPLSVFYLVSALPLMGDDPRLAQLKAVLVGGATYLAFELTVLSLAVAPDEHAGMMGCSATAVCITMFAAPLGTLTDVVRLRSSASIYAPLTVVQIANCSLWSVYGIAVGDVWIWGPNGLGLVLGFCQAGLLFTFPSHGPEESIAILQDFPPSHSHRRKGNFASSD